MCAVLVGGQYIGGASLITPSFVMTAAHKVSNRSPGEVLVRCGDWDTRSEDELFPHQERGILSIIIHDGYNGESDC